MRGPTSETRLRLAADRPRPTQRRTAPVVARNHGRLQQRRVNHLRPQPPGIGAAQAHAPRRRRGGRQRPQRLRRRPPRLSARRRRARRWQAMNRGQRRERQAATSRGGTDAAARVATRATCRAARGRAVAGWERSSAVGARSGCGAGECGGGGGGGVRVQWRRDGGFGGSACERLLLRLLQLRLLQLLRRHDGRMVCRACACVSRAWERQDRRTAPC